MTCIRMIRQTTGATCADNLTVNRAVLLQQKCMILYNMSLEIVLMLGCVRANWAHKRALAGMSPHVTFQVRRTLKWLATYWAYTSLLLTGRCLNHSRGNFSSREVLLHVERKYVWARALSFAAVHCMILCYSFSCISIMCDLRLLLCLAL